MTKIFAIEINNLTPGIWCGQPIPKGCLNVRVDHMPMFTEYKQVGNVIWAETEDFVSCYMYEAGSTRGFAGRSITLPITGIGKVFKNKGVTRVTYKGSLWDSAEAVRTVEKLIGQRIWHIGVRTGISGCYSAIYAKQSFLDRMAKCIVFGTPEQSPEL